MFREVPEAEWDELPTNIVYAVRMLNAMHELDPNAISLLCQYQIPINTKLSNSNLDFICMASDENPSNYTLGVLGIIQGCLDFPIEKYRLFRMTIDEHAFEHNCCVHCGIKKGEFGDDKCKKRSEIIKFGIFEL